MATKKVTELTHADLGRNVVIDEPNSDRNSGEIASVIHSPTTVMVKVGNSTVKCDLDAVVQFTE